MYVAFPVSLSIFLYLPFVFSPVCSADHDERVHVTAYRMLALSSLSLPSDDGGVALASDLETLRTVSGELSEEDSTPAVRCARDTFCRLFASDVGLLRLSAVISVDKLEPSVTALTAMTMSKMSDSQDESVNDRQRTAISKACLALLRRMLLVNSTGPHPLDLLGMSGIVIVVLFP